jgi:uncharacterized protein YecE (DUF72 family)
LDYLVGTGGWSYFNTGNTPSLENYSKLFNFVEVNHTFYEYPNMRHVESWRRSVPPAFKFSVRCHQDLTHKIGLKPTDAAFEVFYKMKAYCQSLETPFLVLETPKSLPYDEPALQSARDFFSSVSLNNLQLVWEYRAPQTLGIDELFSDFGIIRCVDLSKQTPSLNQKITYSRLFGKGRHNIYQFTDDELIEIEHNSETTNSKTVILAYHGVRMNSDALRSQQHLLTGKFLPVTNALGVESAKTVLLEDAHFPTNKVDLVADQGWKVIDLTSEVRVHLSTVLEKIPEKSYRSIADVVSELEAVI